MLTKRIIPCLDVIRGRVTKGVKFKNNVDLGDPVEMAVRYSEGGADELVFYDITASAERRPIDIGMVENSYPTFDSSPFSGSKVMTGRVLPSQVSEYGQ